MSNHISLNKLLINEVFNKWYRIPSYQRPYVWGKEQVIALLDDILSASEKDKNSEYFLGSLVLQELKNESYSEFDVLDGQQRLTTLFLVISVIRDLAINDKLKSTCNKYIFQEENNFENIPERLRIIFDVRDEVKVFVNDFIKNKIDFKKINSICESKSKNTSVYHMARAIQIITEYFNGFDDEKENVIIKFSQFLFNKVILISVSTEKLSDAFKLFSVLNNRGVKLRSADILKAENLGMVKDNHRERYAKEWEDIEDYFGDDFDEFLSHLQSVLVKEKAQVELLREFEDNVFNKKILSKGEGFFKFVSKYKNNYVYLFDDCSDLKLKNLLKVMRRGFESNIWISPLLKYYDKFNTDFLFEFTKKLSIKFLNDWVLGDTPTKRIANMNEVIKKIEHFESPLELFNDSCFNIEEKKLVDFLNGDLYGKRQARYILLLLDYLYENIEDRDFSIPDTISIEHILPQNPEEDSEWKKNFTDEERAEWTDKLGNLIIITRRKNSSQGNLDYKDKKGKYFERNVELGRSASVISQNSVWLLDNIKENHSNSVDKLKKFLDIKQQDESLH